MNTGKLLLEIFAGLAAGATLGILFAPEKGSDTRKKIADKGKSYVDDVKLKYNDIVEGLNEKFENEKQHVGALLTKGKEHLSNL